MKLSIHYDAPSGLLVLTTPRFTGLYAVTRLDVQKPFTGRAYELRKLAGGEDDEGRSYTVLLSERHELADECCCRGSLRWNNCKHRKAMRTIFGDRSLPSSRSKMGS